MNQDNAAVALAWLAQHAATLQALAPEADRLARLPDEAVRVLRDGGLFRLWIPQRHGGLESSLPDALRVYEAAARIDGSVGWAVMIGNGGGLFAVDLAPSAAEAIYRRSDALIAGSGAAHGTADEVAGGYRVNGRWRYASGAHYATTFTANCIVQRAGEPLRGADGAVLIRAMAIDAAAATILPTWNPLGMRGTGSHDFEVRDGFVPAAHSFAVGTRVQAEPGPLYRLPFDLLTELPVTAVASGIAQHALAAFAELARSKRPMHADTLLAADTPLAARYAACHARCGLVQAGLHALAGEAWAGATQGVGPSATELARITASSIEGVTSLLQAIGELAQLSGMSAINEQGGAGAAAEFTRAWRDLQALAAHLSVSPRGMAAAGATLLAAQGASP
jgi:alkylation response protein AidB-like acyl-CoA dehydrogenase